MKKLGKIVSPIMAAAIAAGSVTIAVSADEGGNIMSEKSIAGQRSYSSTYNQITNPGTNNTYYHTWRDGLVSGNGENGIIDDCAPAEGVMVFQNVRFNYPTNAVRMTPDMSSAKETAAQSIIEYNEEYLSGTGAKAASDAMTGAADEWMREMGYGDKWSLQWSYSFHPSHQLRLKMDGAENGTETAYTRYTDYQTAEIGAQWTDEHGKTWTRRSFTSREDNATVTSIFSNDGEKINMTLSVDDISKMANEKAVNARLEDIRYRKIVDIENADYIGEVAHYPFYRNSELKNGGFAGVTRIIVKGGDAKKEYVFGSETTDSSENAINLGYDKNPSIKITNADEVILITKSERDTEMGTLGEFKAQNNEDTNVKNGTIYNVVNQLIDDMAEVAEKYSSETDYSDFDYDAALEPSDQKHAEIFNRLTYSVCTSDKDIAMRSYTNEDLIAAQKESGSTLLPAMLERVYNNGRYAAICCSGTQAPRLGGIWTGAWGLTWSGDYTTDANINLQMAGANIGSIPEQTQGFINVMLRCITDWQLNAKQVYGIDDAVMAPPRTDGDTAVLSHFDTAFPGEMWNSGASWLILPMYGYYLCYGNKNIPLTEDIRHELEFTGNKYEGYTEIIDENGSEGKYYDYGIKDGDEKTIVYNMRNTLNLSDERAEQILEQGYFDLERDILYPLLTKTVNFWLEFVDARYYTTSDGRAVYDETHTELKEGEYYLLVPGFSPENQPSNTNQQYTANSVMDIASAKSAVQMLVSIERDLNNLSEEETNENIEKYEYLFEHLPPYLYEESGELKEWALRDYEENYPHRHGSQLYGLWPEYYGETDIELFNGAKKLIETKNAVPSTDNRSGHGWLHRGLVMARLKDGAAVRDTVLPLVSNSMFYTSMMMSHNTTGGSAYCTDPVITLPAIELESVVYSDADTIELLPALFPEIEAGGLISGTEGMHTRNGGTVKSVEWNAGGVTAVIANSQGTKLKLADKIYKISINGEDVTDKVITDASGDSFYIIETDDEITAEYTYSDIQNGTYSVSKDDKYLTVKDFINNSPVTAEEAEVTDQILWNEIAAGAENVVGFQSAAYPEIYIDLNNRSGNDLTPVNTWNAAPTSSNRQFRIEKSGDYYYIWTTDSGSSKWGDKPNKVFEDYNGAVVYNTQDASNQNQLWERIAVNESYKYRNVGTGAYMELTNGTAGAAVTTMYSAVGENQLWNAEYESNNYFRLVSVYDGKALSYDGEALIQTNCSDSDNQFWNIKNGELVTKSGYELGGYNLTQTTDTEIRTTIDAIVLSADSNIVQNGGSLQIKAASVPEKGISSGIE